MTEAQGATLILIGYGLCGLLLVCIFCLAFISGNQR